MNYKDYERETLKRTLEKERGTWREHLRAQYSPWFDSLVWGFQCYDGWRELIENLTAEIAEVVGGPEGCPELRVGQIKEKFGGLRYYLWPVPEQHADAVRAAIRRAEERSFETCEVCGKTGKLVQSGAYWHTACPEHEDPSTFKWQT